MCESSGRCLFAQLSSCTISVFRRGLVNDEGIIYLLAEAHILRLGSALAGALHAGSPSEKGSLQVHATWASPFDFSAHDPQRGPCDLPDLRPHDGLARSLAEGQQSDTQDADGA